MYENLNDELYFGEVYRTVLQEAWLPEGAEDWQRTGKSRRGRRPTQQGIYPHSPTQDQAIIRQCFSKCVAAWNALPWDNPSDPPCDDRWGKEYWKQLKDDQGVPCSYYDLFMRHCLRFCLDTECLMPSCYKLDPSPSALTAILADTAYGISFSNACGPVSLYQGPGSFDGTTWTSPAGNGEGTLGFQDENGAKGCVTFKFKEFPFFYDPDNPDTIAADSTIDIKVLEGVPPFTWATSASFTSFGQPVTESRTNQLSSPACHPLGNVGTITVTDSMGTEVSGPMQALAGTGTWVFVGVGGSNYIDCKCKQGAAGIPFCQLVIDTDRWDFLSHGGGCGIDCGPVTWGYGPKHPPCSPSSCCGAGGGCALTDCAACGAPPWECTGTVYRSMYAYYHWVC